MPSHPTSWVDARADVLDRLVERAEPYDFFGLHEQLLEICADLLALSRGRDLVLVGRSPEKLHDLLCSLFGRARRAPQLISLPFSFRVETAEQVADRMAAEPELLDAFERNIDAAGLHPARITEHPRGVVFVDCVCWGSTFGSLDGLLGLVAKRRGVSGEQLAAKSHFVGITRESVGWSHWKNDVESGGKRLFAADRAGVIPVSARLWSWLARDRHKTMESYVPEQWAEPPRIPELDEDRARSIRTSVDVMRFGRSRDVRRAFAAMLSRRHSKRRPWLGAWIVDLLKSANRRR